MRDLIRATQAKNEQLVNNVNDGLIDLRNAIIRNENSNKITDIFEKILKIIFQAYIYQLTKCGDWMNCDILFKR